LNSTPLYTWQHNKLFWIFTIVGWSAYLAVIVYLDLEESEWVLYKTVLKTSKLISMLFFCLLFRHISNVGAWSNFSISRIMLSTAGYAITAGMLAAFFAMFFLRQIAHLLIPESTYQNFFVSPNWQYVFNEFYWTSINCTFIIGMWVFAYIATLLYRTKKNTEIENLKLNNAIKEAQLSALGNQLNPHFMLNALNNIRAMVRDGRPESVEMITAISEILKSLFSAQHRDKIEVREEIETVGYLVDIAKIQYGDKLHYEEHINEQIVSAKIPTFAAQLLVENAVKHGLEVLKDGCSIVLSIQPVDDELELTLTNNGNLSNSNKQSTSVGLLNLKKRLQLLYGERAQFSLKQQDKTVKATIRLPLEFD
jgi:hypothetical protein